MFYTDLFGIYRSQKRHDKKSHSSHPVKSLGLLIVRVLLQDVQSVYSMPLV